ncbi:MAG: GAF domain-containing protein [Armatimonadetes bacterium]|nr:GAF domain-containing protein [Armatimonadota bacterium]
MNRPDLPELNFEDASSGLADLLAAEESSATPGINPRGWNWLEQAAEFVPGGDPWLDEQRAEIGLRIQLVDGPPGPLRSAAEELGAMEFLPDLAAWSPPDSDVPTLLFLPASGGEGEAAFVRRFREAAGSRILGAVGVSDAEGQQRWSTLEPYLLGTLPVTARASDVRRVLHQAAGQLREKLRYRWLQADFQRLSSEMLELQAIGVALSAERDLQALLTLILTKARELTQADSGTIWVVEERGGDRILRNKAAQNASVPIQHREFAVPVDPRSIAGWVALTGQPFQTDDVYPGLCTSLE